MNSEGWIWMIVFLTDNMVYCTLKDEHELLYYKRMNMNYCIQKDKCELLSPKGLIWISVFWRINIVYCISKEWIWIIVLQKDEY